MQCQYCGRTVEPDEKGSCPYCGGNPGTQGSALVVQQLISEISQEQSLRLSSLSDSDRIASMQIIASYADSSFKHSFLPWMLIGGVLSGVCFGLLFPGVPANLFQWLRGFLGGG